MIDPTTGKLVTGVREDELAAFARLGPAAAFAVLTVRLHCEPGSEDPGHACQFTVAELATAANVSVRTMERGLAKATADGWIVTIGVVQETGASIRTTPFKGGRDDS